MLPECFVCSNKHYLADCDKFKVLPTNLKRQTVFDAKRCLNCLSLNHMVRNCAYPSKCRKCRPDCRTKHATALHDYYVKPDDETLGAAEATSSATTSGSGSANDYDVIVNRKIDSVDKRVVLLRTCAVRVINPDTKKSTLAYAQLDTASQATLISERLCNELGLKRNVNASTAIHTLGDFTTKCNGHSDFDLTSLADGKTYGIKGALIVSNFEDD